MKFRKWIISKLVCILTPIISEEIERQQTLFLRSKDGYIGELVPIHDKVEFKLRRLPPHIEKVVRQDLEKYEPKQPTKSPASILNYELRSRGFSLAELSDESGIMVSTIRGILAGKIRISKELSKELGSALGISETKLYSIQEVFDLN